ncbi:MAG: CDP-diacylglycerol--glycerol-3-phosphate 3-phosphatidyltransferase [Alphaproteobacteria bacterium]|nr:CDP-diacylglycerol--glycerol-3-phosphate 3-phosphatidyltransferase [Alphaproteobacteria bacterium]
MNRFAVRDTIYTWPNLITITRIFVVLPVIGLIHAGGSSGQRWYLWVALGLMLVSEFTDWLDGYLARRMQWVSSSGKVLDPMADSLYRISVFVALVANGWMPVWMLLIMAARDLGMSEMRLLAQRARITLAARWSGKVRAAVQGLAQFATVLLYAIGGGSVSDTMSFVISVLLYLATAVTLWSVIDYTQGVLGALRQNAAVLHDARSL